MKTISTALSAHFDQEVTTLASCWKIVRKDGMELYFTDHDQDIVFEGNTYEAESSYDRTAVQNGSDFGVDNLDVNGVLDSEKLSEEDMRNGLYNRADVYVFLVNWMNPSQGALKIRRGWFGEVSITDTGMFTTEIRGLNQALSHNFIEVYTAECRADFCDTRCKLNIADFTHRATVSDRGDGRLSFAASDIPDAPTVGTSAGAHRYWSIKPTGYPMGGAFFISEVRFRDQDGNLISGGTAYDNIPNDSDASAVKPKNLRDGNYNSRWGFDSEVPLTNKEDDEDIEISAVRWWIDFGSAKDVAQVEIIATDTLGQAFTAFDLQYIDTAPENGSIWETAASFSFTWTAKGQSAVWALGSPTQAPINIAETPTAIPSPFTGASSYIGGTIKWVTGKNKGRTIEILDYNTTTRTVTMFEGASYAIEVGDTFDIAQGCDRTLTACKLYDNVINRRAEDYVPGMDELMQYPDAK